MPVTVAATPASHNLAIGVVLGVLAALVIFARPGVVWLGEALPTQAFEEAVEAAANADVLLTAGTSGVVYPAAEIPQVTARLGGQVIQINPTRRGGNRQPHRPGRRDPPRPGGRRLARPFGRLVTYGRGGEGSVALEYGDRAGAAGHVRITHSRGRSGCRAGRRNGDVTDCSESSPDVFGGAGRDSLFLVRMVSG